MTAELTREHLETFVFDPHRAAGAEVEAMAHELIAARARVAELEAAQRPPLGYVVLAHYPGQAPYLRSADIHAASTAAQAEADAQGSGRSGKWRYTVAELREASGGCDLQEGETDQGKRAKLPAAEQEEPDHA